MYFSASLGGGNLLSLSGVEVSGQGYVGAGEGVSQWHIYLIINFIISSRYGTKLRWLQIQKGDGGCAAYFDSDVPLSRTEDLRATSTRRFPAASTASSRLRSAQKPGAESSDVTPRTPEERTRIRADIRMRLRLAQKTSKRTSDAISADIRAEGSDVAPYTTEESARVRADIIDRNEEYSRRFFRQMEVEKDITESRGGLKEHYESMIARHKEEEERTRRLLSLDTDSVSGDDADILSQCPFSRDPFHRESLTQRAVCPDPEPKNSPSLSTLGSDSAPHEGGDLSILVKGGSDDVVSVEP